MWKTGSCATYLLTKARHTIVREPSRICKYVLDPMTLTYSSSAQIPCRLLTTTNLEFVPTSVMSVL